MNPHLCELRALGQTLWLDGLSRDTLRLGRLASWVGAQALGGVGSQWAAWRLALTEGSFYDEAIADLSRRHGSAQALFMALVLADVGEVADLLRAEFDRSSGTTGWVSFPLPPTLADDARALVQEMAWWHQAAGRPNVLIQLPGTPAGLVALEAATQAALAVQMNHQFSAAQWQQACAAHWRGLEQRQHAGLPLAVAVVVAVPVRDWEALCEPPGSPRRLGLAVAQQVYHAWCVAHASARWQSLAHDGARAAPLLWQSGGEGWRESVDYLPALVAQGSLHALSGEVLDTWLAQGQVLQGGALGEPLGEVRQVLSPEGGYADAVLEAFRREGLDDSAAAERFQHEAQAGALRDWDLILAAVAEKMAQSLGAPLD